MHNNINNNEKNGGLLYIIYKQFYCFLHHSIDKLFAESNRSKYQLVSTYFTHLHRIIKEIKYIFKFCSESQNQSRSNEIELRDPRDRRGEEYREYSGGSSDHEYAALR